MNARFQYSVWTAEDHIRANTTDMFKLALGAVKAAKARAHRAKYKAQLKARAAARKAQREGNV